VFGGCGVVWMLMEQVRHFDEVLAAAGRGEAIVPGTAARAGAPVCGHSGVVVAVRAGIILKYN
jgi:hypothetical protein